MAMTFLERLWDAGESLLAQRRYVAARSMLERAEGLAWRRRDAATLARIQLPLLETRRQIRYLAAEGEIIVGDPGGRAREEFAALKAFSRAGVEGGGTILLTCGAGEGEAACRFGGSVAYASRRTGRPLEALVLIRLADEVRLATATEAVFAAGVPVVWTRVGGALKASSDPQFQALLPPPGRYGSDDAAHAVARETLLLAWEAIALKWQRRHPPPGQLDPWEEIAWLRMGLRVDPACEPVAMRVMAVAEGIGRSQ